MEDPYLNTDNCVNRLVNEFYAHKKLIIAVDFDSTVSPWPLKSKSTHNKVLDLLRQCNQLEFYVVVFTASAPERYDCIKDFFRQNEIKLDGINKNPINLPFGNHGKIYYNILLDDRAGLGQAAETLKRTIEKIKEQSLEEYQTYINSLG